MDPFVEACKNGDLATVSNCLTKGENNFRGGLGNACYGNSLNHLQIAEIMLSKGADSNFGLAFSCLLGNRKMVELMISKGANKWNFSFSYACRGGHLDIAESMISKGANDWESGAAEACRHGHKEIVELMISKGANNWNYHLLNACRGGHPGIVILILSKGANNLNQALGCAFATAHYDIVSILLTHGATHGFTNNAVILKTLTENHNLPLSTLQRIDGDVYNQMCYKYKNTDSLVVSVVPVVDLSRIVSKYLIKFS